MIKSKKVMEHKINLSQIIMISERIANVRDPEIRMISEAKNTWGTSNIGNGWVLSKDLQATRDQHGVINEMSVTKKKSTLNVRNTVI